jgi:hypothetical protein
MAARTERIAVQPTYHMSHFSAGARRILIRAIELRV